MEPRTTAVTLLIPEDDQAARAALFDLLAAHPRVRLSREVLVSTPSLLPERLTPREIDLLTRIARGLTNKEIAEDMGIAEGTARNSVSAILQKLGAANRAAAVAGLAVADELAATAAEAI